MLLIWVSIDLRHALRAEPWVAVLAIGGVACTSAASSVLYAAVALLTASLRADLETGSPSVVVVEPSVSDGRCRLDEENCRSRRVSGEAPMALLRYAVRSDRREGRVAQVLHTETALRGAGDVQMIGVTGADAALFALQSTRVMAGRLYTRTDERLRRPVVLLGRTLFDSLVHRGVLRARGGVGEGLAQLRLAGITVQVIGVVESGAVAPVPLNQRVIVPLTLMARLAGPASAGTLIGVLESSSSQPSLLEHWQLLARKFPARARALSLSTTRDQLGEVADLDDSLRAGVRGLSLVLVLAGLVAVSALVVTVARSHTRAVGIARAMGAGRSTVVLQGAVIGLSLGGAGVLLGTLCSVGLMSAIPVLMDTPPLTASVGMFAVARGVAPSLAASLVVGVVTFARLAWRRPAQLLA